MKTNFTALDFIVLVAYLIATTVLGIWLGRNQKDSKDYFVAGHRIPWWAVLFSVVATETSALTLVCTYYGGMRAVVWTDVLQTSVYLLGGLSAVYLLGKGVSGGWNAILGQAHDAGKLRLIDVYFGFDKPYTLFAGLIGGAFLSMASHGADQLIVQRLLAASSLKESRKALIGSGIAVFFQFSLFLMIGIGLYAFYHARPFAVP